MVDIQQLHGTQLDNYELKQLLGVGGMSAVYRAYQSNLDRDVAVKILSPDLAKQENYAERFNLEARMSASLEHVNIVPVYDYGTEGDLSYVVMRLLTGGTLSQRLTLRLSKGDEPSLSESNTLIREVSQALAYAHRKGVVHRDIKPSNIMFDNEGAIFVVDFGIARVLTSDLSLTSEGIALGTPNYMAPEQWRSEEITPAVDQYALAVVVFYMLTGERPFNADTYHGTMYQHLNEPAPLASSLRDDVPMPVANVLHRALSKDSDARYPNIQAFSSAFAEAVRELPAEDTGIFTFDLSNIQPAEATVPNTPPASSPQATLPNAGGQTPIPSMAQPDMMGARQPMPYPTEMTGMGDKTILKRMAVGGGLGLGLLFIMAIGAGALIIWLLSRTDTPPPATPEPTADTSAVVETTAPQPTEIQLTPIIPPTVTLAIGEVGTFQQLQTVHNELQTPIRSVAFHPNSVAFASGHGDGLVRLWASANQSAVILRGHTGVVNSVAFSPTGQWLATASDDTSIRVWDVSNGTERFILAGHSAPVRDVAFSPDGTLLASASEDRSVRLWDIASGNLIDTLIGHQARALTVAFSPAGRWLVSGGDESVIYLWDVASGALNQQLFGHTESVRQLAFNPDGSVLASSSTDNSVRLWDMNSFSNTLTFNGHTRDIWALAWHPNGELLASGGSEQRIKIWEAISGQEIQTLPEQSGWILGLDFSRDGTRLISSGGDGTVRLFDATPP